MTRFRWCKRPISPLHAVAIFSSTRSRDLRGFRVITASTTTARRMHRRACMQIREQKRRCLITLQSGLTLELCYGQGTSCGLWMFGDRILWGVVAGVA
jgi:hypothetical protein